MKPHQLLNETFPRSTIMSHREGVVMLPSSRLASARLAKFNFHYEVAILCRPYLELQTSKLDNLGIPRKLRRRYKPFLLTAHPTQSYEHKFGLTHLLLEFHGLACNTQQFSIRESHASKIVNELAIRQHHSSPPVRECGMCAFVEHPTNACPFLQEIEPQRYKPPPPFRPQQPMQHVQQNAGAGKVVAMQPPLPSMVQSLQPPIITANNLQVEQKEKMLQVLKKLGDFYEHLVKHSTLRFLLKKPLEDVTLELITSLNWKTMITLTLGTKGALAHKFKCGVSIVVFFQFSIRFHDYDLVEFWIIFQELSKVVVQSDRLERSSKELPPKLMADIS
ncbi:hypothetical protein CR513_05408, partial [Mucuna pruriens]